MITILVDRRRKAALQRRLLLQMREICPERIKCILGYRGKQHNRESTVYYSSRYNFWYSYLEHDNRYWNAFGIGRPIDHRNTPIIVEINIPYQDINRGIEGAFGEDALGNLVLLHRGGVGGGRQGIGKRAFMNNFYGDIQTCWDGDRFSDLCIVGAIQTPLFARQIANFVEAIAEFKEGLRPEADPQFEMADLDFFEEAVGRLRIRGREAGTMRLQHGVVVNSLKDALRERQLDIGKNKYMDIYIRRNGTIKVLFEVKLTILSHDLCKGVGQLLLYSIDLPRSAKLILVIPRRPHAKVVRRLRYLGIEILFFHWEGDTPVFSNLDASLR